MNLIDIGVNLCNRAFAGDHYEVVARAEASDVGRMIITGTNVAVSRSAAALASAHPGRLWSTCGVHPHSASTWITANEGEVRGLVAAFPQIVAIGECGLDFNRDFSPRDMQMRSFEAQLELAADLRLPVFLHERDAHDAFMGILRRHRASLVGGVVHCFTGQRTELEAYLDLGLHIGITGWVCDERRGQHLAELLPLIPEGRLLIETDAPYLLPRGAGLRPNVSGRNEPCFLPAVLAKVSAALGQDSERVAAATTAAAETLFSLRNTRVR